MKYSLIIGIWALFLELPATSAIAATNRNYAGVKTALQKIVHEHSDQASLFVLGESDNKEQIVGVKIGTGSVKNLVVATHHGNEYGSAEVALAFAESLAKEPIAGQTIFVLPVLNITGYNSRTREERSAGGKRVDPNRDYPGPCGTEGPYLLKSTRALADFTAREKIVNAATLHTHFPAVVYPWGFTTRDLVTQNPEIFLDLVKNATVDSHYQIGNSSEVIYPANGTFEDYAYWNLGTWSILFELGFSHSPSDEAIQTMIRLNVPGLKRMLANAPLQVAQNHQFTGKCDASLRHLDRHDE